jgi:hypothetical protein
MKPEFKPVLLFTDTHSMREFNERQDEKAKALQDVFAYIRKFLHVENPTDFKDDIYGIFLNQFYERYVHEFPPIGLNKMLELMSVNTNYLVELINTYHSIKFGSTEIEIDWNTGKAKTTPSFDIYTETPEQNKLTKTLEKLIASVNELKEMGRNVYVGNIIQGTQGAVTFDQADNMLKVNHSFVLDQMR